MHHLKNEITWKKTTSFNTRSYNDIMCDTIDNKKKGLNQPFSF